MSGGASFSGVSSSVGLDVSNAEEIDVEIFPMLYSLPYFEEVRGLTEKGEPHPRQVAFGESCLSLCVECLLEGK